MATADELIMQITGEDYHEDLQFIIDENLRTIAIPKDGVVLGVCGDKDINRVNFRMNRYYNGFDLSEFNVRINYINANGEPNYFVVTDIQVDVDYIIFTWLVDAYATRYVGEVSFCVRLFTESEGKIDSQFFSTIGKVSILEGIQVDSQIPEAEVYDLITRISSDVEDKIQTKADAAIASIPADYTALSNDVSELKGDLTEYGDLLKNVDDKSTTMITTIDLDKTNWSNGYINTDGKITSPSDTNWKHTDFINVMLLRGLNITYHLETYSIVNGISFYDENKTYISGSTSASTRTVEIPSNAYYVRFSCNSEQLTLNDIYVKMPLKKGISDLNLSNNVRLVMIGDSYGIKNTDGDITKFYWEYVKDALGLIENVDFFQRFAEGHGFGSGGYLANLKSLNITDKNKITDIFVCGGWNDCDKSQSYGTDEAFESGILEFNNYVKANFPNATISVAHISWGLFGDNAFYQKMNTSLTRYIYACNKFGWRFISNVEYILRKNDSTLWASDMAHPSNKGQKLLGENLTSPFLSGSADTSYMFNSNTVIIGDKKIMLNSDNSISWSNIN